MKQTISLAITISLLGTVALGTVVQAEENNPTAISQATLEVKSGPLKMTGVDHIDFDQVEINGQIQTQKGNDVLVKFSDYRGAKAEGFTLKVKSDTVFTDNGLSLSLTPTTTNKEQVSLSQAFDVTNEFKQVAVADKEGITGEATDYELGVATEIAIFKTATPGTHQTVLTWDLSATPNE